MAERTHVEIGNPPKPEEIRGLDGVLGDCHERIRRFTDLARRLARTPNASPDEIAEAAGNVARYFSLGLPLHEADEEESLAPRLRGRTDTVDAALEDMQCQHAELHKHVDDLVALTAVIAADPAVLSEISNRLAAIVHELDVRWDEHLSLEESVIFPAVLDLRAPERDLIRTEMRLRRD